MTSVRPIVVFAVITCGAGLFASCSRPGSQSTSREGPTSIFALAQLSKQNGPLKDNMDLLVAAIKRKDYTAIRQAQELGSAAVPALSPLAAADVTADPDIRELAIQCAAAIAATEAGQIIVNGLLDPDPAVRTAAYQGLAKRDLDPTFESSLLDVFKRSQDPLVRKNTVLVLGRIEGTDMTVLAPLCRKESNREVQEGCMVALAKLGDAAARADFAVRMARTSAGRSDQPVPPERKKYLDYADYIHAPWLLRELLPLLDDRSAAVRIGVDGVKITPEYLRVSDLAVNLVASISQHSFSFSIDKQTNYSDAAIDEVRRFLISRP